MNVTYTSMKMEYSVLGYTDIPCMEIFAFPHNGNLRGNPRTEKKEHTKTKQNRRTSIETVSISVINLRFIYAVK